MVVTKSIPDFSLSPRIDQVGVEERASRFTKRSIKNETKIISNNFVFCMKLFTFYMLFNLYNKLTVL